MSESINQLINDGCVCRTAPATPGLLNIPSHTLIPRTLKNVIFYEMAGIQFIFVYQRVVLHS